MCLVHDCHVDHVQQPMLTAMRRLVIRSMSHRPAGLPAEVAWDLGAAAPNLRDDVEDAHMYASGEKGQRMWHTRSPQGGTGRGWYNV